MPPSNVPHTVAEQISNFTARPTPEINFSSVPHCFFARCGPWNFQRSQTARRGVRCGTRWTIIIPRNGDLSFTRTIPGSGAFISRRLNRCGATGPLSHGPRNRLRVTKICTGCLKLVDFRWLKISLFFFIQ